MSESILSLCPAHRQELQASGLSDATIEAAGIYSENDRRRLASMLNRRQWSAKLGGAIVFPYIDETGTVVLKRVKPDRAPENGNGKAAKYLTPSGSGVRVYFSPGTYHKLNNGSAAEILITEGEKKSLAVSQAGWCCLGLSGVDCWHGKQSAALLPDMENIEWQGRTAFIVFDSDASDNPRVQENESLLAAALERRGATVKVVRLSGGVNGDKVGVDDFLVSHGAAALRKLLDRAEAAEPPEPDAIMQSAHLADPGEVAKKILAGCELDGLSRLRFWQGGFWWWGSGRYQEKPDAEVRAEVVNQFCRDWFAVKSRHVSDAIEHLRAKSLLSGDTEPPTWLGKSSHNFSANDCLATKSGVICLPSLVSGVESHTLPASPKFFTLNATDFDLDLSAPKPEAWYQFLNSLWPDDMQSVSTLQEIFGYLLTLDTRQQKIFLLVGPKRSGKGTIARVLAGIVGKGNVAAPTLAGMSTNFGLSSLIGKSLAIISDARLSGRADQVAVVERLLSISGEDAITIDRKHLQPLTYRLPTRFVILTNELPRLSDASGAIVSRIILLHTTKSFYGHEDHGLTDTLLAERQGILLWAIQGWQRLHERGRFVQPDTALESLSELDDLASPVGAFVRDCCEVNATEAVVVPDLFAAWKKWCEEQGREKYVGNVQGFGRDLSAAVQGIRRRQHRDGGSVARFYEGIGLKEGF